MILMPSGEHGNQGKGINFGHKISEKPQGKVQTIPQNLWKVLATVGNSSNHYYLHALWCYNEKAIVPFIKDLVNS